MLKRLIVGDLRRGRVVAATLACLIALATTLVASSASLIGQTFAALDELWQQAVPPSLVQMSLGEVDESKILEWADAQSAIDQTEVIKTLPVSGSSLWLAGVSQAESVLEPAFITSPELFDFLIDADGEPVQPGAGEVVLPVIYQATGAAAVGDPLVIQLDDWKLELTVSGFARDAQMNTSLATSKRLVLNQTDFAALEAHVDTPEYLIEFLLHDDGDTKQVSDAYLAAGLPAQGISVDSTIFRLVNSLTTILVAVAALLVAALLALTSALALRFALLAAVETDLPEIGTLKAIGASPRAIKRIYLAKYVLLAGLAAGIGLAASAWLTAAISPSLLIYLGTPPLSWWLVALPIVAAVAVFGSIVGFAWLVLRRIDRLSATEALRNRGPQRRRPSRPRIRLSRSRVLPLPVWLGVRGALAGSNWLIVAVIGLSTFLMTFPAGVANTLQSPSFMAYLGVGQADVRIDVRDGAVDFSQVQAAVDADPAVGKSVTLISNRYEVLGPDGWESLVVELGDHSVFPLVYELGSAPTAADQIALSHNEASALGVGVGSSVQLKVGDQERALQVSGIYQDITNGGKTGKATFTDSAAPLWQVILLDLNTGTVANFVSAFSAAFPGAKVTPMTQMTAQVMGTTTGQLSLLATISLWAGAGLAFLMVVLQGVLAFSKERGQVAALRAIGTSTRGLWAQYLTRFALLGVLGLAVGLLFTVTGGQVLFGAGIGALGAPGAQLILSGWFTWVGVPAIVLAVVTIAAALALRGLSHISIQDQE